MVSAFKCVQFILYTTVYVVNIPEILS